MDHDNIFEIAFNAKAGKYGDEDLLTDLFAWYLRQDTDIAFLLVNLLTGCTPSKIKKIETQPTFVGFARDFPDMVIKTPEIVVICEHKVSSPLGHEQLERYLKIAISEQKRHSIPHCLIFIARDLVMVAPAVQSDPHYYQDQKSAHFRWRDIYRLIHDNLSPSHPQHTRRLQFLDCLRYLKLAFLNPSGEFDLLFSKDPEFIEQKRMQESSFGDAWKSIDGTVSWFEPLNFKPDYGSRKELYLISRENAQVSTEQGLKHMHISPVDGSGMPTEASFQPPCLRLIVHLNKNCAEVVEHMIKLTPARLKSLDLPVEVNTNNATSGPVQFWLPLIPIITSDSLSDSLRDAVTELYTKVILPAFKEPIHLT